MLKLILGTNVTPLGAKRRFNEGSSEGRGHHDDRDRDRGYDRRSRDDSRSRDRDRGYDRRSGGDDSRSRDRGYSDCEYIYIL